MRSTLSPCVLLLLLLTHIISTQPAEASNPHTSHAEPTTSSPVLTTTVTQCTDTQSDLTGDTEQLPVVWERLDGWWSSSRLPGVQQVACVQRIVQEQKEALASLQERFEALEEKLERRLKCCPSPGAGEVP